MRKQAVARQLRARGLYPDGDINAFLRTAGAGAPTDPGRMRGSSGWRRPSPMTQESAIHALKRQRERVGTDLVLLSAPQDTPFALKKGRYLLNTDATVRKGEAAIGVVLSDPADHLVETYSDTIGPAMIQEAEYKALIKGLELALAHRIPRIAAYLDNQLVVDQINGLAQVKHPILTPLHHKAVALLDQFPDQAKRQCQRVYWVSRERNEVADALVSRQLH